MKKEVKLCIENQNHILHLDQTLYPDGNDSYGGIEIYIPITIIVDGKEHQLEMFLSSMIWLKNSNITDQGFAFINPE